jgi:hypothetical protein
MCDRDSNAERTASRQTCESNRNKQGLFRVGRMNVKWLSMGVSVCLPI